MIFRLTTLCCLLVGDSLTEYDHDEMHGRLVNLSDRIQENGLILEDGYYWIYSRQDVNVQTSRGVQAAESIARLKAIEKLSAFLYSKYYEKELSLLSVEKREVVTRVLSQNTSLNFSAGGLKVLKSNVRSNYVELYIFIHQDRLKLKTEIPPLVETLRALGEKQQNSVDSRDADKLFEACAILGLEGMEGVWIRSNPKFLQPILKGGPVNNGIRSWMENHEIIQQIIPDLLDLNDIKRALILLPFNEEILDLLENTLQSKNLNNVAQMYGEIRPRLSLNLQNVLSSQVLEELDKFSLRDNIAVAVIAAAKGDFPSNNEKRKESFQDAMNAFIKGDMNEAFPHVLKAFQDSYNADTINLLGAVLRRSGAPHLGLYLCKQAAYMDPEHPFALMNVALAYEALGVKEKSVSYSYKAVKLNPEDPWVLHETRRIQKSRDH